jgi:glycolate oxidase iron-sulfur subunit
MFDFMDMEYGQSSETSDSRPYIPDAGECMRCGMCVSSCPTFKLFQIDEETPRRRIRTIAKLLAEQTVDAEELTHLNNCLQCRACETACPSRMAYGQLFDQAQAALETKPGLLARTGFWLIERKDWLKRLLTLVSLYLASGLSKPLRRSGLLNKLGLAGAEALLKKPELAALNPFYPASTERRGCVALFTGCIAEALDRDTLTAAISLLNAIGYDVEVPSQQGCCGAIHQHNGQSAADLIANNIKVFNGLDVDAVIHTASGCGVMLNEYQAEDVDALSRFSARLADINDFLLSHWPDDLKLRTAKINVAVHEPCSQRNVLKNQQAVYSLLGKIPQLSAAPLADNHLCCGAGGTYMLSHPENAGRLRDLKLQAIGAANADSIVSGNFGCATFLNAGSQTVLHPLRLLADSLPTH